MLKVNDICEFKIIDTGINFEGISKTEDGLTVFIPDALKGEVVTAKIIKVNKSYALGNLLDIKQASGHRCKEDCEYYNICGGCSSRHTDYENTLEIKKANVINTLKKQDISDSFVKDIYGMGNPYYYRNKVQYPVRKYKGETIMGMFAKATHDIVQNRYCLIQDKIIDEVAKDLFDLVIKYHLEGYDESKGTGEVRNIMVRRGTHTGEIMCVLVLNNEKILQDERLDNIIKQITCKYHEIVSFVVNINTKITNVILTNSNMCVYGREYILDIIGDYIFKITADSFFQVNTIQAEVLYNVLKEKLELNKDKTLLELYSGVGSIGIFLSDSVKDVYSVEIVESAVLAAKENAKINNAENIINVQGDATKETLNLLKQGKYFDYLVVDPPRKGLDLEGVELILKLKPKKIGYVSCNVATLARDLKLLAQGGYDIKSVDMVDMFPWTSHVECCALLCLK